MVLSVFGYLGEILGRRPELRRKSFPRNPPAPRFHYLPPSASDVGSMPTVPWPDNDGESAAQSAD